MELVNGQIVQSRRGRDTTKWYMVCGFEKDRVLLCDGNKWPLAAPKKKNPRHLQPTGEVLPVNETDTDVKLKAALKHYANARPKQGG